MKLITANLVHELQQLSSEAVGVSWVIAFTMKSGVKLMLPTLQQVHNTGTDIQLLVGDYLSITQLDALQMCKYMQNEKPYAPLTPDTVYIEKVLLLILDRFNGGIVTQVDEAELESSRRLWILYKLADRSEKGADKIIDYLIDKYRGFPF